jgi:ureidoglycolate lyase
MSETLTVRPLTRAAFALYGDVIEASAESSVSVHAVNDGRAERFHDLARIDTTDGGGRTVVSIFRTQAITLPYEVAELERHPRGTQAFIPMHTAPFLVVVAATAADGSPGSLAAFATNGSQGISFRKGTWHHSLLALRPGDFLVIDREENDGDDCETARLAKVQVVVRLPAS